jgi:hypothetical protein
LSLAEQVKGDKLNDKKFHVTIEDNKSNVLIDFQEGVGMSVNVPGSFNITVPHIPRGLPFNLCFLHICMTKEDQLCNLEG